MRGIEYRRLVSALRAYDPNFRVYVKRGKGSHRMIFHPDVGGGKRSYPIPYHGEKTVIASGMLTDIVRRFELPEDFFASDR